MEAAEGIFPEPAITVRCFLFCTGYAIKKGGRFVSCLHGNRLIYSITDCLYDAPEFQEKKRNSALDAAVFPGRRFSGGLQRQYGPSGAGDAGAVFKRPHFRLSGE